MKITKNMKHKMERFIFLLSLNAWFFSLLIGVSKFCFEASSPNYMLLQNASLALIQVGTWLLLPLIVLTIVEKFSTNRGKTS